MLEVVTALIATAALIVSIVALTRTSNDGTTPSSGPTAGIYMSGALGQPHYYVAVTNDGTDLVRGALGYVYQDGQTSVVFTFRGTSSSLNRTKVGGVMIVTTSVVAKRSPLLTSSVPATISVTYGSTSLDVGECGDYLEVTSLAGCHFTVDQSGAI